MKSVYQCRVPDFTSLDDNLMSHIMKVADGKTVHRFMATSKNIQALGRLNFQKSLMAERFLCDCLEVFHFDKDRWYHATIIKEFFSICMIKDGARYRARACNIVKGHLIPGWYTPAYVVNTSGVIQSQQEFYDEYVNVIVDNLREIAHIARKFFTLIRDWNYFRKETPTDQRHILPRRRVWLKKEMKTLYERINRFAFSKF